MRRGRVKGSGLRERRRRRRRRGGVAEEEEESHQPAPNATSLPPEFCHVTVRRPPLGRMTRQSARAPGMTLHLEPVFVFV